MRSWIVFFVVFLLAGCFKSLPGAKVKETENEDVGGDYRPSWVSYTTSTTVGGDEPLKPGLIRHVYSSTSEGRVSGFEKLKPIRVDLVYDAGTVLSCTFRNEAGYDIVVEGVGVYDQGGRMLCETEVPYGENEIAQGQIFEVEVRDCSKFGEGNKHIVKLELSYLVSASGVKSQRKDGGMLSI